MTTKNNTHAGLITIRGGVDGHNDSVFLYARGAITIPRL
jgi:hypothetical protein